MSGFLPAEMRQRLPAIFATQNDSDPIAQVKLFTPWSSWTWYLLEYDGDDLAFAWVEGHDAELGYVSLRELANLVGPMGLRVECDLSFTPAKVSTLRRIENIVHYGAPTRDR